MKRRTIVGIIFIAAALLRLIDMWGICHLEFTGQQPWTTYFGVFLVLYIGIELVISSYQQDPDQWLQRPIPPAEEGKRMCCSVRYGGDKYIFRGEPFHGARIDVFCGGIRLDLRKAVITEDEEIDIHSFMGGVELIVAEDINVEVKNRNFIGSVANRTNRSTKTDGHCLHIIASNMFGSVSIKNKE